MLIRPLTESRIAEMRETIRSFNAELQAANSLAEKPRIATERAISVAVLNQRKNLATSMNDILNKVRGSKKHGSRYTLAYLLDDPIWGPRIREWSDRLNSSKRGT